MAGPFKVAGIDVVCWITPNKALKSGWEHHSAARGEIVDDVPDSEVERLAGYLVDPDAADDTPAEPETGSWEAASDEELRGMTVDRLHAYLGQVPENQHDDEIARIVDLEQERDPDKQRSSVLSLAPDFEPAATDPDDLQG